MNPTVGTTAGGSETTIRELARLLSERHEVWILTGKSRSKPSIPINPPGPTRIVEVPYWPRFSPPNHATHRIFNWLDPYHIESLTFFLAAMASRRARSLLASVDVISTHFRVDSELFSGVAEHLGVASVFHVQGADLGRWFRFLDRSTRYVGVSEHSRRSLEARTGVRMHSTVTPGVPEILFKQDRDERKEILFVGRLQPSKRADWAVRVFSRVAQEFPEHVLEIVGDGPSRRELEDLVKALSLERRTRFRGELSYNQVWPFYASAMVLLMPSKYETYALVPLEAMAAGVPVIASDVESLRLSASAAVFAPPEDLSTWATSLGRLLRSNEARQDCSDRGRQFASRKRWSDTAREYEKELLLAKEDLSSRRNAKQEAHLRPK